MIFRIPAGRHRARPLRFGIWWNKKSFTWNVQFTDSCRYDLKSNDQYDMNKLCGVGFIPGFHHKDSARFGWRYSDKKGMIELSAYCYVDGNRVINHICFCEIGKTYRIQLRALYRNYVFECDEISNKYLKPTGGIVVKPNHMKKLQYRLGIYFGGSSPCPHEIKIDLKKL
jgi:hypothetical protein